MTNKRFFAFGCSYTRYIWPSWADIIGQAYQNEYYNYGQAGAGNIFIFNMLMQADQYCKITKDDLVIVQWSSTIREDRYINNEWITRGAIDPNSTVGKLFDMRGYLIRDLGLIKAAKALLENIGCEFYFISMSGLSPTTEIDDVLFNTADIERDVTDLYKDIVNSVRPSFYDVLGAYTNRPLKLRNGVYLEDSHRIPSEHLRYIKKVLPDIVVDEEFVADADKHLFENYEHKKYNYNWKSGRFNGIHNIKRL